MITKGDAEMVSWVKMLATNTESLSSVFRTYIVGENYLLQLDL